MRIQPNTKVHLIKVAPGVDTIFYHILKNKRINIEVNQGIKKFEKFQMTKVKEGLEVRFSHLNQLRLWDD